jgi:hypothetical protein
MCDRDEIVDEIDGTHIRAVHPFPEVLIIKTSVSNVEVDTIATLACPPSSKPKRSSDQCLSKIAAWLGEQTEDYG